MMAFYFVKTHIFVPYGCGVSGDDDVKERFNNFKKPRQDLREGEIGFDFQIAESIVMLLEPLGNESPV